MRFGLCGVAVGLLGLTTLASGQGVFLGQSRNQWITDLSNPKPAVRRSAAFALGRMTGPDTFRFVFFPLLERFQKDDDASVREMAATALGNVVQPLTTSNRVLAPENLSDVLGALQKGLTEDKEPRVKRASAFALGCLGRSALPAAANLKTALKDANASVRQNAAWALGQIGKEAGETVGGLVDLLGDANALVRRDAAGALGAMQGAAGADDAVAPLLQVLAKDKDEVVRKTTLESLARLAGPKHKDAPTAGLERLLEDREPETQLNAALVLAQIGGPKALPAIEALRKALKDKDASTTALASAALGRLGPDAAPAVVDLANALKGSADETTRRNAALALAAIGERAKPAVPVLAEALDAKVPVQVRQHAAEALARLEFPTNEAALSAVVKAIATDTDPLTRQRSVWALFKLPDLDRDNAKSVLTKVLDETSMEHALVRYDAARLLANKLEANAPDRTPDVLLEMLQNKTLKVYNKTETTVEGGRSEAGVGRSGIEQNLGGDARYMPAEALGWLMDKARKRKDVISALKEAAKEPDPRLRDAAKKSLEVLGVK